MLIGYVSEKFIIHYIVNLREYLIYEKWAQFSVLKRGLRCSFGFKKNENIIFCRNDLHTATTTRTITQTHSHLDTHTHTLGGCDYTGTNSNAAIF